MKMIVEVQILGVRGIPSPLYAYYDRKKVDARSFNISAFIFD